MSWARGMVFKTDVDTVDAQLKVINNFGDESSHCGIVVLGRQLLIHADLVIFNSLHQTLEKTVTASCSFFRFCAFSNSCFSSNFNSDLGQAITKTSSIWIWVALLLSFFQGIWRFRCYAGPTFSLSVPTNPSFTWMGKLRKSKASVFTRYKVRGQVYLYQILEFYVTFPQG